MWLILACLSAGCAFGYVVAGLLFDATERSMEAPHLDAQQYARAHQLRVRRIRHFVTGHQSPPEGAADQQQDGRDQRRFKGFQFLRP